MEKTMENNALPQEALDEVNGGIIESASVSGVARLYGVTQQNLDVAHNLIAPDQTAGMFNVAKASGLNNVCLTDAVEDKNFIIL